MVYAAELTASFLSLIKLFLQLNFPNGMYGVVQRLLGAEWVLLMCHLLRGGVAVILIGHNESRVKVAIAA